MWKLNVSMTGTKVILLVSTISPSTYPKLPCGNHPLRAQRETPAKATESDNSVLTKNAATQPYNAANTQHHANQQRAR